jgi:hypothetical protein
MESLLCVFHKHKICRKQSRTRIIEQYSKIHDPAGSGTDISFLVYDIKKWYIQQRGESRGLQYYSEKY